MIYAVIISLPLIMLRGIYGLISVVNPSAGYSKSLAVNVCLSVVPQLLIAVIFVLVGILTRHIDDELDDKLKRAQRYAHNNGMEQVWSRNYD